jgi:hypothetical protein
MVMFTHLHTNRADPQDAPALRMRVRRFKNTTGALSWNRRSAEFHPDACTCQDEATPHTHYTEFPHACARCLECKAYTPRYVDLSSLDSLRIL